MPASHVLVLHDDGLFYPAEQLGPHRDRSSGGPGGSVSATTSASGCSTSGWRGPISAGLSMTVRPAGPIRGTMSAPVRRPGSAPAGTTARPEHCGLL